GGGWRRAGPPAAPWPGGASGDQPRLIGAHHVVAMLRPVVGAMAAAVIDGDDEGRRIPVFRVSLNPRVQLAQVPVDVVQRVEDPFVVAIVRPVVGLVEGDVEGPR